MYKLEVKLKQHTPLIHFQWDQEGATLRASEVKPKLDRFVLEKLGKEEGGGSKEECYNKGLERAKTKGWLIGESKALDYKMRIVVNDKPVESLITARYISETTIVNNKPKEVDIYSGTSYFAQEEESIGRDPKSVLQKNIDKTYNFNVDKWKEIDKKGLEWKEIILSITSFYDDLGTSIEGVLREFFICTNFGTRSTKGFGSFEVIEKKKGDSYEGWELLVDERKNILKENFDFVYEKVEQENPLAKIKGDYQIIKSGTNYNKNYTKSLLFCYAADEKNKEELGWGNFPRWEKRKLKQLIRKFLEQESLRNLGLELKVDDENHKPIAHIKPNNVDWEDRDREGNLVDFNYLYLRALLGVTDQYFFALQKKDNKKCDYRVIVKVKANEIDRYSSPLFFKIINNTIYLVGKDNINNKLLGGEFQFTIYLEKQEGGKFTTIKQEEIAEPIKVPESFSLSKFIEYAMAYQDEKGNKILKYAKI